MVPRRQSISSAYVSAISDSQVLQRQRNFLPAHGSSVSNSVLPKRAHTSVWQTKINRLETGITSAWNLSPARMADRASSGSFATRKGCGSTAIGRIRAFGGVSTVSSSSVVTSQLLSASDTFLLGTLTLWFFETSATNFW